MKNWMPSQRNNLNKKHNRLLYLAFEQAKINLGSTKSNPSVGCIVEKDDTVLSSGVTSFNGRPHAEFNALNKNKDFKKASLYVTMEPCCHFGKTPPCTRIIIKKKIGKIFFASKDFDPRTKNKLKKTLKKNKIYIKNISLKQYTKNFYGSYSLQHSLNLPLIDAKIAITNDYFTKHKKQKWISGYNSRKVAHLLRSMYDCLISTSKTINNDNAILDCRIEGLERKSPDLVIIDRNLTLKNNLKIFQKKLKRKIIVFTLSKNKKKINKLKKKGVILFNLKSLTNKNDYKDLFLFLKRLKYSRIFLESGITLLNFLIKEKFINNIYIFKSNKNIKKHGINFATVNNLRKIKLKNRINVYLKNDDLYKEKLK